MVSLVIVHQTGLITQISRGHLLLSRLSVRQVLTKIFKENDHEKNNNLYNMPSFNIFQSPGKLTKQ
jgi:hypothetical protein